MKATVKESHTFKPITVELVIENEVELAWLKAISNSSIISVRNESDYLDNMDTKLISDVQTKLFNFIERL